MEHLLAIDPSLTSSGWALFSVREGTLKEFGVISPPPSSVPLPVRLKVLQAEVEALYSRMQLTTRDVVICEGPAPLVVNPESALRVERVRGIFEAAARSLGIEVPGRINPRTVQTELLGMRGKQLARKEVKRIAREIFLKIFGDHPGISQDAVDAALIGVVALSRIKLAISGSLPLVELFNPKSSGGRSNRRSRYVGWSNRAAQKLIGSR